jgi:signal peptidase II
LQVILGVTAVLVIALDQISKAVVVAVMPDRAPIEILGGLITITYVRNPGASFSIGSGLTVLFTVIAVAVAVVIVRSSRRLGSLGWALALGGLLGGAVGNLLDRLTRSPGLARGEVIDWIDLIYFPPVFNLADVAITFSAAGLVVLSLRGIGIDGTRVAADRS